MQIHDAQLEMRRRYAGGAYGQAVSGLLWLLSAALLAGAGARPAILALVLGGFLIFPLTEALARWRRAPALSAGNALNGLGLQVAFVLPLSMLVLVLVPVGLYRLEWFHAALAVLVGAHYLPFVFLYGMPMFALLGALLMATGVAVVMLPALSPALAPWIVGALLLVFAAWGGVQVRRERQRASRPPTAAAVRR